MVDEIEFSSEELNAATTWHGGQGSMLYAIASTGSLRRGTIRPMNSDTGQRMTDTEWFVDLCERLESEASATADDARKTATQLSLTGDESNLAEIEELTEHAALLDEIAYKADLAAKGGNPNI